MGSIRITLPWTRPAISTEPRIGVVLRKQLAEGVAARCGNLRTAPAVGQKACFTPSLIRSGLARWVWRSIAGETFTEPPRADQDPRALAQYSSCRLLA